MDVTFKYAGRILNLDEVLEDLYCNGGSPKTQLELLEFVPVSYTHLNVYKRQPLHYNLQTNQMEHVD